MLNELVKEEILNFLGCFKMMEVLWFLLEFVDEINI